MVLQDTSSTEQITADHSARFLFEQADIRGQWVQLHRAYTDILAIHQYAPGVSRLLGEFLAASVLLSGNLKFEGRLTLQVRSQGQLPLLMVECNDHLQVRGIARGAEEATADNNAQLLTDGQLAITIEPEQGQRYQGIVPLHEDSLAASLDAYFMHSEQLQTRIWLAADGERAGGLLLQQLPPQVSSDEQVREEHWERATALAATTQNKELLNLSCQGLLYRLYVQNPLRLFSPDPVTFACTCSRTRSLGVLASLGPEELRDMLAQDGKITMDCEFCQQQYLFEEPDLVELLGHLGAKTLH